MSRYVLLGPMGAGKSTVGALLARRLGCELVDTDVRIAQETGRSVQQIFAEDGEAAFRRLEREVVQRLLNDPSARVIALGGGAVLDPGTQIALGETDGLTTVFLDVPASAAPRRIGSGAGRPLLAGDATGVWLRLLAERRPLYERLATVVVDTGQRTPAQVADAVLGVGVGT